MSHYLFLEGANNQFKIPDYNPIYRLPYYEQSYIYEVCNSYREEIRNIQLEFVDIISNREILTEGERWDKVVTTVKKLWNTIIGLLKKAVSIITNAITTFISKLKKSPKDDKDNKTDLLMITQKSDYFNILNNALSEDEYKVDIPELRPSDYLVDSNFPVTKLFTLKNMEYVVNDLRDMAMNLTKMNKPGLENTEDAVHYIEKNSINGISSEAAKELFGPFSDMYNDQDKLMTSVDSINRKAFGDDAILSTKLTMDIYSQAKENDKLGVKIIDDLSKIKREVENGYRAMISMINDISKVSEGIFSGHKYVSGPYKNQHELMTSIMGYINSCANTVQDIIFAHSSMYVYKLKRLTQLYGGNNYSSYVMDECDKIVMNYIKKNEATLWGINYSQYLLIEADLSSKERNNLPDSDFGLPKQRRYPMPDKAHVLAAIRMFNHVEKEYEAELAKNIIKKIKQFDMASEVRVGKNNRFLPYWEKSGLSKDNKKSVKENAISIKINHNENDISRITEMFNRAIEMVNHIYIEESFSEYITNVLEADNNQPSNNSGNNNAQSNTTQTTTTQTTNNNQQQTGNNASKSANGLVSKIITAMANMFKKFTDAVNNSVTLNAAWWKLNKDKVASLDISKVKVNDWYDYNTDALSKSFTVEFDINQPYLNTDEAMQNAIIQKIGGTVNVAQDSSFTEKVKSLFRVDHINMENSDGVPFSGTKTNKETMTKYVDDFQKGFNGGILKSLKDDIDKINSAQKLIQRQYNTAVKQTQTTTQQTQTTNTQQNNQAGNNTQAPNNTGGNNNQNQAQNAGFNFDLAGTLGLMEHKELKDIFEAKFAVNDELKQQVGNTGGDPDKVINDKIARWFKWSSQAAGAKMTEAMAAYNQYIQLYKAIVGGPKKQNNNQQQNNQNQQNNQQQNQK